VLPVSTANAHPHAESNWWPLIPYLSGSPASEANRRWFVEDREWNGAIILGPAVVIPFENVQIISSNFDVPPEILFVELPLDRPVVGFVGLRNVTFRDCQFQGVGFAAPAEVIASFRDSIASGNAIGAGLPHADSAPERATDEAESVSSTSSVA
jgi:hypothetical protein